MAIVDVPEDVLALARQLVKAGRYRNVSEVIAIGLRLVAQEEEKLGKLKEMLTDAFREEGVGEKAAERLHDFAPHTRPRNH